MIIGEEYTVRAEKMLYEGKALARINNIPIFIDGACPDDLLKIKISKINKHYINADIIEIIEKSKFRVKPLCPLHNVCGSCNWQYIDYQEQLRQKQQIVEETLNKIAGEKLKINTIIPSPNTSKYRCKIQMPAAQTKVSKRLLSGYYKKNSHNLVNIKYCPMQPDIINEINNFIKEKAAVCNISGYDEISGRGLLRHIIYRISSDLKQILIIFAINSTFISPDLKKLSKLLTEKYPEIKGVCANFNVKKTNVIMSSNTSIISGRDYYIETLGKYKYKISANSFFQVNPLCAVKIFDTVKNLISSRIDKPSILDAYSGVSSFGIWLSDIALNILSIEEVKSASLDAVENIKMNNISNIKVVNAEVSDEFKKLIEKNVKFDVSVIDPPRKGSSENALNSIINLTLKYIIYVSCNPATLARDMNILKSKNFIPVYIQPADMFVHTSHIETIVVFEKFN